MLDYDLLRRLCEAPGPPGAEGPVKDVLREALEPLVDEVEEDALGNLLFRRRGPGPAVLLDAHLDEVALVVSALEEGFLRVVPLGGVDAQVLVGQRVVVWGRERLTAVVGRAPEAAGASLEVEDLFLDPGLAPERVSELVRVGDLVTFPPCFEEGEESIVAKALDDRVGLFVMVEALRRARALPDLYLSATVQEEVGLRGAEALAHRLEVQVVLALEGTLSHDLPGVPLGRRLARLGQGPEIRLTDARLVADRRLAQALSSLAQRRGVKHQVVVKRKGGTNATAYQVTGRARCVGAVSVPVRYLHAPAGLARKEDIEGAVRLVTAFLEEAEEVVREALSGGAPRGGGSRPGPAASGQAPCASPPGAA